VFRPTLNISTHDITNFFSIWGSPSLCIKMMHIWPINLLRVRRHPISSITIHGSHKVATWMSQQKMIQVWWYINGWLYYATISRTGWINPELPSPNGCTQNPPPPAAPLVGDKTYRDTLQKIVFFQLVKDK
jgi:hypothetical protein